MPVQGTDQAVYSIAATARKTEAIHDELYNASGTHRIKDVVVVTSHTTRVLITIFRLREPLEGAEGPTKSREHERTRVVVEWRKDAHILSEDLPFHPRK